MWCVGFTATNAADDIVRAVHTTSNLPVAQGQAYKPADLDDHSVVETVGVVRRDGDIDLRLAALSEERSK